jgi:hypothetical protein
MNLLLIALAAYLLFFQNKPQEQPGHKTNNKNMFSNMEGMFGDGAKNLMDSFSKLNIDGDKTGAIMDLLSNPIVFNIVKSVLFKDKPTEAAADCNNVAKEDTPMKSEDMLESIAKEFKAAQAKKCQEKPEKTENERTPSLEAVDFFAPVERVCGIEISQDLYHLYDDWYLD